MTATPRQTPHARSRTLTDPAHRHAAGTLPRHSFADRARHRLRRHRDEPALRHARVLPRPARHRAHARERLRRAVAHLLGAHPHHLGQVLRLRPARRQPRRGRHPRPHRSGDADQDRQPERAQVARRARHLRGGAPLRRRHHHARHLRARRRRRLERGDARLRHLRRPATVVNHPRLFLIQSRGTAQVRPPVRPVCSRGFFVISRPRRRADRPYTRRSSALSTPSRIRLLPAQRLARLPRARTVFLVVTGGEASTPTWPLRQAADSHRLVRARLPASLLNYLGQGRC